VQSENARQDTDERHIVHGFAFPDSLNYSETSSSSPRREVGRGFCLRASPISETRPCEAVTLLLAGVSCKRDGTTQAPCIRCIASVTGRSSGAAEHQRGRGRRGRTGVTWISRVSPLRQSADQVPKGGGTTRPGRSSISCRSEGVLSFARRDALPRTASTQECRRGVFIRRECGGTCLFRYNSMQGAHSPGSISSNPIPSNPMHGVVSAVSLRPSPRLASVFLSLPAQARGSSPPGPGSWSLHIISSAPTARKTLSKLAMVRRTPHSPRFSRSHAPPSHHITEYQNHLHRPPRLPPHLGLPLPDNPLSP
jgi:hypothetical protein